MLDISETQKLINNNESKRNPIGRNEFEQNLKKAMNKEEVPAPVAAKNKDKTLNKLNDILFDQIEKLVAVDDDVELNSEIRKTYAITTIASQIISNANTCINAMKLVGENKIQSETDLKFLGIGNEQK